MGFSYHVPQKQNPTDSLKELKVPDPGNLSKTICVIHFRAEYHSHARVISTELQPERQLATDRGQIKILNRAPYMLGLARIPAH